MTMIPPKIKRLPKLHKQPQGYAERTKPNSMNSNKGNLYQSGAKTRNS